MRSDLLHVVCAYSNPMRWRSRRALAEAFQRHVHDSGAQLTIVECAHGERDHELTALPGQTIVRKRAHSLVWHKESLLNLAISALPDAARYIAWIDADVTFRRPDWAAATVHALQLHPIVQPWWHCHDLGPNGEHVATHTSFAARYARGEPIGPGYTFAHPGYAWAATRAALEHLGGLIETAPLGAADHHMALALAGRVQDSLPGFISDAYARPLRAWQDRAARFIAGNVGVVPGTIEHGWHGRKSSRRYVERWSILRAHGFDPDTDLKRNTWGVLELAGNKPGLRDDIRRYFEQRNEDGNLMEDA